MIEFQFSLEPRIKSRYAVREEISTVLTHSLLYMPCFPFLSPSLPHYHSLFFFRKKGLYVIDLKTPEEVSKTLYHRGKWDIGQVQFCPHSSNLVASAAQQV